MSISRPFRYFFPCCVVFVLSAHHALALSPLLARGYTAIPEPQQVSITSQDVRLGTGWKLALSTGLSVSDPAAESILQAFGGRVTVDSAAREHVIRLEIKPGGVTIGTALDREKAKIAEQAYKIVVSDKSITITGNAAPGLFYGAQTLVQLLKPDGSDSLLPEGTITDWPDLQLRQIYWDDAHHLDRLEYLKHALRTAAFFHINGFALKLEGHFLFRSAPAVVEPWALTPEQFQELTDYGLRYHVQLIPYLDGPAHVAFLLKHPEYRNLRAYPDNNYELCMTNPDSYKFLFGLFDDLLKANKGVHYFYLSTDEAYYAGMPKNAQCDEQTATAARGSRGKLLAEFVTKAADYLHDRGREVIFWGEYPLKLEDLTSLPKHIVNGEVYGPAFDRAYRAHGIRQTIYTAIEGEEKLFPEYFGTPAVGRLHSGGPRRSTRRVMEAFNKIANDSARTNADLKGAVIAGWADMGLHTETFWLGYAAATAAAWNPRSDPRELMSAFYPLYFGRDVVRMDRAYQLLSDQARFWEDSWESGVLNARKPILGNSNGIYPKPVPARDQFLPLPPVPAAGTLQPASNWTADHKPLLDLLPSYRAANEELTGLLQENLPRAEKNQHGLAVFLTIADLCRENLDIIDGFRTVSDQFEAAHRAASNNNARQATAMLDRALDRVIQIRRERNRVLADTTRVWSESWHLRTPEANGRKFLHELDDVKDHLPDRTADMTYLVYRELLLPLDDWFRQVLAVRNQYAGANGGSPREASLNWRNTSN